jgi:hypothetical protein
LNVTLIEDPETFISELINSDPYILVYTKCEKLISNSNSITTIFTSDNSSEHESQEGIYNYRYGVTLMGSG